MGNRNRDWTADLDDEDLAFIKRFVLLSGSLKDTAGAYQVSYPTVRLRLDRLIAKIEVLDEAAAAGPFERLLRASCAEGKLDRETMKRLLDAYQRERRATRSAEGEASTAPLAPQPAGRGSG